MSHEKDLSSQEKLDLVKKNINSFSDFPKPGILFRDIFSVLKNPMAFKCLKDLIIEHVDSLKDKLDVVVGLDSRGFLLGPIISLQYSIPFVPVRKQGKLPGETSTVGFSLEYGTDTFEVQKYSLKPGQKALVIDDLLATGGSLTAACILLQQLQVKIVECFVIMELSGLKGREKVTAPVFSLVQY